MIIGSGSLAMSLTIDFLVFHDLVKSLHFEKALIVLFPIRLNDDTLKLMPKLGHPPNSSCPMTGIYLKSYGHGLGRQEYKGPFQPTKRWDCWL